MSNLLFIPTLHHYPFQASLFETENLVEGSSKARDNMVQLPSGSMIASKMSQS